MPLTEKQTKWYAERINGCELKLPGARVDEDKGLIIYSSDLKSDETNTKNIEPEELVHALAINLLLDSDYQYTIDKLYHEQKYHHGSKGSLSDEVDLIIYDEDGLPYAVWEF